MRGPAFRIGFVALSDAAPVVVAHEAGLYAERGLRVELVKQASWPALRDALLDGSLNAAHCLASLPLSVACGITGRPDQRLPIVMMLAAGGQAITVAPQLAAAADPDPQRGLAAIAALAHRRRLTLAMTHPGGTHDLLLRYWLASAGVGPGDVDIIPIPPAQMVANLRGATMDGYAVGDPWNAVAVDEGVGITALISGQILADHPEKALVATASTLASRRAELTQVMGATLQACRDLDDAPARRRAAHLLAARRYVNAPAAAIESRLLGRFVRGADLPALDRPDLAVAFSDGGRVNAPRRGHGRWFVAQMQRLGLMRPAPVDTDLVRDLMLRDLYCEVAAAEGVVVPDDDLAPFEVALDGVVFDPHRPHREATRPIGAPTTPGV